ncbi:MAG: hypothetical protein NZ555_06385 [Geminicoccaceae bacterium]|nr:hypothetical protein [Geminicoccaceae bacterium]MDW8369796.1 hypothetical protein [Geminicoccaceae bacterium]
MDVRGGSAGFDLASKLDELNHRTLEAWRVNPDLVQKDARE